MTDDQNKNVPVQPDHGVYDADAPADAQPDFEADEDAS